MKIENKKILITGGASGIGLAMAERFLADGNTVVICGRRETALAEAKLAHPELITIQADLSSDDGRNSLVRLLQAEHPDLNVLINNAGIQQWMTLDDETYYERAAAEIAINVSAPVHLTQLLLNFADLEVVMNVTSGLAFVQLTKTPVYCATKSFLHAYTRTLRFLLQPKGIKVIELIPPALNTDLGGKGIHDFAPPVSGFIDTMFEQLETDKEEITYQFSEAMLKAGPAEVEAAFQRLNQPG